MALRGAHELAAAAAATPNATYKAMADRVYIPYDAALDYHPEFVGWNESAAAAGALKIKQADAILMQYPLRFPMNSSTAANDMRIYDHATGSSAQGIAVAMDWAVIAINHRDLGQEDKAAHYFKRAYNTTRAPFYEWHEQVAPEGSNGQGAPNFVTGAGGFLQAVVNGYGGVRYERVGQLTLRRPRPPPNSTALTLRGVHCPDPPAGAFQRP
jgi:trehalose/maltose hydrolase-like predicted phosphorylase